jgi:chromate transporter
MEDEVVRRRGWVSPGEFADLVGASQLIPGPNSTELALHLGYRRGGWWGLVVAGGCFIVPAVVLVWVVAMVYGQVGVRGEAQAVLRGIAPVMVAVVVQAAWRLRGAVWGGLWGRVVAVGSVVALVAGVGEVALLAGVVVGSLWWGWWRDRGGGWRGAGGVGAVVVGGPWLSGAGAGAGVGAGVGAVAGGVLGPWALFGHFAVIGSALFGSGYVLLAFLRGTFVTELGVLSEGQLLDAIAVGQVTPGPVFSAATFVGYLLGGHAGAAAATAGIFAPAFVAVALTAPLVRRLRQSAVLGVMLDGVNAASVVLLGWVAAATARGVVADAVSVGIFVAAGLLLRAGVASGWVLLGGGVAGGVRLLAASFFS